MGDKEERFKTIKKDLINSVFKGADVQMALTPRKDAPGNELLTYIQNSSLDTIVMGLTKKR